MMQLLLFCLTRIQTYRHQLRRYILCSLAIGTINVGYSNIQSIFNQQIVELGIQFCWANLWIRLNYDRLLSHLYMRVQIGKLNQFLYFKCQNPSDLIILLKMLPDIQNFSQTPQVAKPSRSPKGMQNIFRVVCVILFMILIFCVPGFLKFRAYCELKNYYVFAADSFKWCTLGFFIAFAAKYSYFNLMAKPIERILNPNYDGETRDKKTQYMLKLSYDTIFYTIATVASYLTFRKEYWFPTAVGGCGSCAKIYSQYPNWPSNYRPQLQIYFCFQLGVHIFSIFELIVFKKNDRKYYEWMLHHFMAASLILFSMMCNEITAGVMILIIHDASDIFMAGCRFYFEAHIKKSKYVTSFSIFMLFFSWIYLRIIVFPFCLLSNVYINKPLPTDEWYIIHWEYLYLLTMAFVLFGMHLYWTFCLIKSAVISLSKDKIVNDFDSEKRK